MRRREFLKLFGAVVAAPLLPPAVRFIKEGTTGDPGLDEAMLKRSIEKCWEEGGDPEWMLVGEKQARILGFDPGRGDEATSVVVVSSSEFGDVGILGPHYEAAQREITVRLNRAIDRHTAKRRARRG